MGSLTDPPHGGNGSLLTPTQEALWALVLSERPFIRTLSTRAGVYTSDLDDAVQIVLVQAWRIIRSDRLVIADGQDRREAIRSWLVIVTRNATHTMRRKQRTDVDALDEGTAGDVSPIARLEAREELRQLTWRLNREERALLAALASGESLNELAARMGIPSGTIHTRARKLRRILRARLAK